MANKAGGKRVYVKKSAHWGNKAANIPPPSRVHRGNEGIFRQKKLAQIFPEKILTKVITIENFYVPSGTAAGQYYCTVLSNSYFQPFNSSSPYSGANFGSAVNSTGGSTTDAPAGYNDAVSYYTYYKCHKYKVEVTCMPLSNSDPINYCIASYNNGATSSINTFSQQEIAESSSAKTGMAQATMKNKLSQTIVCRKLLGMSKIQYKGIGPTAITGAPPSQIGITTGIRWETINNTALTSQLCFQVKLTQWIELMVPDVLNMV